MNLKDLMDWNKFKEFDFLNDWYILRWNGFKEFEMIL